MSLHRKYGELFPGQRQIGQLATSATEKRFLIWVLPGDASAVWSDNGHHIAEPLNPGVIMVYGPRTDVDVFSTEHTWFHTGPWQDDFKSLVDAEARKRAKQALESTNVLARYKRLEVPET